MSDNLKELTQAFEVFLQIQNEFMQLLQAKRNFPQYPVDLESKQGQKFVKDIAHECMDELFEGIQHLRNSKSHRLTNVTEFNKSEYIEELVDSFKYFTEICILSGITAEDFVKVFVEKTQENQRRINDGY